MTNKSLHDWIKKYGDISSQHQTINGQQDEIRKLKAELRRVTEERDIVKEAAACFALEPKKYAFVKSRLKRFSIKAMYRVLDVYRSGSYA